MIPDWIAWTLIFMGLLALAALALLVTTVAVYLIQARRDANPVGQIHKLGKVLVSSPDRDQRRAGFDLIRVAHALDYSACGCPASEPISYTGGKPTTEES